MSFDSQFITDLQAATDEAKATQQDAASAKTDKDALFAAIGQPLSHNPDFAVYQLLAIIFGSVGQPGSNANIVGVKSDAVQINGDQMQLNGAMVHVTADISNMFNSKSDTPGDVKTFFDDVKTVSDLLDPNQGTTALQQSLGADTSASVKAQLDKIHAMYDPNSTAKPTPTGPFFTKNGIQTFAELQADLAKSGDANCSTECASTFTVSNQADSQTFGTTSAVLNNNGKMITTQMTAWNQFGNQWFQSNKTMESAANQAMARG